MGIAELLIPNPTAQTPRVGSVPLPTIQSASSGGSTIILPQTLFPITRPVEMNSESRSVDAASRTTLPSSVFYLRQRIGPHALNDNRRLYLEIAPLARARLGSRVVFFLLQDLDFSHFARLVASRFARLRVKPTENRGFRC